MATVIQSKSPNTKVQIGGKTFYTSTKTTYETDQNGLPKAGTVKHEFFTHTSPSSTSGVLQATSSGNVSQWTPTSTSTLTAEEKNALKSGSLNNAVSQQIKSSAKSQGLSQQQQDNLTGNNTPTPPPSDGDTNKQNGDSNSNPTPEDKQKFEAESGSYRKGTRSSYGDLKYPSNLQEQSQDCVRFSILEYIPSLEGAKKGGDFSTSSRQVILKSSKFPVIEGSKRLGTITLPIPGGISDSNRVDWQSDSFSQLQQAAGKLTQEFLSTGSAKNTLDEAGKDLSAANKSGDLEKAVQGYFGSIATSGANIAGRAYGVAANNNIELLFSSPGLRTFSFRFLFSPRSEKEAKEVMKIIRAFKQSMAVKRSETSLLLKAPRTFAIAYTTSQDGQLVMHPYLNRFKECALTDCSVDYTPDGSYMTYWSKNADGRSMTSYTLNLQFQELVPIFDDEYDDIDKNQSTSIGY